MKQIIFLCDGQGAVKLNAGKDLYAEDAVFRRAFDEVGSYLEVDNKALSWGRLVGRVKTDPHLAHAYAISHQYALFVTLQSRGILCDVITGHSLGEIIAAILAGIVPLEQGVRWVETRGKLFKENARLAPSDMVVLRGEATRVNDLVTDFRQQREIFVANRNSPTQVVVAIAKDSVGSLLQAALQHQVEPIPLNLKNGCHSKFVAPIQEPLQQLVESLYFSRPTIEFYSGSRGETFLDPAVIREHFISHLLEPVDWFGSTEKLIDRGSFDYVEVGHSKILKGLMAEIDRTVAVKIAADCLAPATSRSEKFA